MFSICASTYCLPVRAIVTTRINELVPMTMPKAVMVARTRSARKAANAWVMNSPKAIVLPIPAIVWGMGFAPRCDMTTYPFPKNTRVTPIQTKAIPAQRLRLMRSPRKKWPPSAPAT